MRGPVSFTEKVAFEQELKQYEVCLKLYTFSISLLQPYTRYHCMFHWGQIMAGNPSVGHLLFA